MFVGVKGLVSLLCEGERDKFRSKHVPLNCYGQDTKMGVYELQEDNERE